MAKKTGRPQGELEYDLETASGRLAKRLRDARGNRTLAEVSQATGIHVQTLFKWERAQGLEVLNRLEQLAEEYGKTLSGMVRG